MKLNQAFLFRIEILTDNKLSIKYACYFGMNRNICQSAKIEAIDSSVPNHLVPIRRFLFL